MSRWFRHYAGLTVDPKFGGIARRSKATKERVVFVWCCLLESAADANDSGSFGIDPDGIADLLACDTTEIEAILTQIEAAGLIAAGRITKWSARQFESDTSASRMRRMRERKRHGDDDVTSQAVTVTPPDTDTDTEKDSAASVPNGTTAAAVPDPIPPSVEPPSASEPSVADGPPDDPDTDPEGWFWAQAPALAARGVARSRLGALVQLHGGDWRSLVPTLRDVIAARNPSSYLGAIVANLKAEQAPPDQQAQPPPRRGRSSGEPDFVRSARAEGLFVSTGKRDNGRPWFKIATTVFDEAGNEIGF